MTPPFPNFGATRISDFGLLGVIAAFLLGLFSDELKRIFFGARIKVLTGTTEQFQTRSPALDQSDPNHLTPCEAIYIRAAVKNFSKAIARSCRAYLVNIERQTEAGEFQNTRFADSMQLPWANSSPGEGFEPLDVPYSVNLYFDIVWTSGAKIDNSLLMHWWRLKPFKYDEFWRTPGAYRLSLVVAGEGFKPAKATVVVRWDGTWESLRVL